MEIDFFKKPQEIALNKAAKKIKNKVNFFCIPQEIIAYEIAQPYLSLQSIFSLRRSCKRFGLNPLLKTILEKKKWEIKTHAFATFFIRDGVVFALERPITGIKTTLKQVVFPKKYKIVKTLIGSEHIIFCDEKNNYYGLGKNQFGQLTHTSEGVFNTPLLIELPNKHSIANIFVGDHHTLILDHKGKWHGFGIDETLLNWLQQKGKNILEVVMKDYHILMRDVMGQWYGYGEGRYFGERSQIEEPVRIELPNNEVISEVVLGKRNTFFKDRKGEWFFSGSNDYYGLGQKDITCFKITSFKLENQRVIKKIVAGDCHTFVCDDNDEWYVTGHYMRMQYDNNQNPIGWGAQKIAESFQPFTLTNNKKIVTIITHTSHGFYYDESGKWHYSGPTMVNDFLKLEPATPQMDMQLCDFSKLNELFQELKTNNVDEKTNVNLTK